MSDSIGSRRITRCILCGSEGRVLYGGLRDRLFDAPGIWGNLECSSEHCGLIWLDPMPLPGELHKAYASYYTHEAVRRQRGWIANFLAVAKRGYLANHFGYGEGVSTIGRLLGVLPWLYPGRSAELDFSVMWLRLPRPFAKLLDVGSGSGWLVAHLGVLGWEAEGVDFDQAAVHTARASGLKIHHGSLADQRFGPESFDAVTMSHSLEHVPDPLELLSEARRVLRPGGRLAIATPNTRSLLHRGFGEHWFALDPPRHLHLFNRTALKAALRKTGFERYRIFTSVRDANGALLGSRSIQRAGRHDMMASQPFSSLLYARTMQLAQLARSIFDNDAGEDLVALVSR